MPCRTEPSSSAAARVVSGLTPASCPAGALRQSLSLRPLAAVNDTFLEAAIVIASPVAGFRP